MTSPPPEQMKSTRQWSRHIRRQWCQLEERQQHQAQHNDASRSLVFFPDSLSHQPLSHLSVTGLKLKADDEHRPPGCRPDGSECFWQINHGRKSQASISVPTRSSHGWPLSLPPVPEKPPASVPAPAFSSPLLAEDSTSLEGSAPS
jgi:hypothetical protein